MCSLKLILTMWLYLVHPGWITVLISLQCCSSSDVQVSPSRRVNVSGVWLPAHTLVSWLGTANINQKTLKLLLFEISHIPRPKLMSDPPLASPVTVETLLPTLLTNPFIFQKPQRAMLQTRSCELIPWMLNFLIWTFVCALLQVLWFLSTLIFSVYRQSPPVYPLTWSWVCSEMVKNTPSPSTALTWSQLNMPTAQLSLKALQWFPPSSTSLYICMMSTSPSRQTTEPSSFLILLSTRMVAWQDGPFNSNLTISQSSIVWVPRTRMRVPCPISALI